MKVNLTDLYLKNIQAPNSGYDEISDLKRLGLKIRVYSSKQPPLEPRIVFRYEKRIKGGANRKQTLGNWPAISLSEARSVALELEAEAAKGIDRVALKKKEIEELASAKANLLSVKNVIDEYDQRHLTSLRTRKERLRQLNQSLEEHLDKSIGNLKKADLMAAIDKKITSGSKVYANRIRAALLAFTKWAWERDYLDTDIGAGIPKPTKELPRDRVLSLNEMKAIWHASFKLNELWGSPFRLLLLTAQRRTEIFGLEWDEIDLDRATIIKLSHRTKNKKPHTTHLSEPALEILKPLRQKYEKSDSSSNLLFTTTGVNPLSGFDKMKKKLNKSLGEEFKAWTLHDMRTGFTSIMADSGEPEHIVDRILNHSASGSAPSAVARVYNQAEYLDQRAEILDKWASLITSPIEV